MEQTAMQQFLEWLVIEWGSNPDFSLALFDKIEEKGKELLEVETKQHIAIYNEGMRKSEGMMNFLYTEVEGKVDVLHNSRHKV